MSSRDVSAVMIMKVWPFIISLACVGLVVLFCIGPEAEAQTGGTTVGVNCAKGGSINNALKLKADPLTIEIRGECHEDVVVSRNNVTLRGVDPGATVVAQANQAIRVDRASRVSLENLTVTGSTKPDIITGAGIFLFHSSGVVLSNVKAEGNDQGMRTYGSSLRIVDSDFCRNSRGGLYIAGGSSLFIDGAEINTNENGRWGFLVSESTVRVNWPSIPRVVANDGGGAGIALQGTGASVLIGPFEAKRNTGAGVSVLSGSFEGNGEVSENSNGMEAWTGSATIAFSGLVSGNHWIGLLAEYGGQITDWGGDLIGNRFGVVARYGGAVRYYGGECRDGEVGVDVHGGFASIGGVTIQGNEADVNLDFGAMVTFEESNDVGTIYCDDTVLVRGDVSCPVTTGVTVSPLQIERVAPKGQQPDDPKPPRWIP